MRTALVVNVSAGCYNLGAEKLQAWLSSQGYSVTRHNGDPGLLAFGFSLVCLSVIFSWHAPIARDVALRVRDDCEVWVGGPGLFALKKWFLEETGIAPSVGVDQRFDKIRGTFKMTFASRGCPVGCWFCIVPKLEGTDFTLDWDFDPAPILCDNNLSGLPTEFQSHIVEKYRATGTPLMDANSGFEPRSFDIETRKTWEPVLRGPWRFAYDELKERDDVRRMMTVLSDVPPRRKRVYLLTGNEPIADCLQRMEEVIAWGGEPYAQYVLPLNWLGDPSALRPRHDWTYQRGRDFCRYVNRFLWKSLPIAEYRPRVSEPPPFVGIAGQEEART